MNDGQSVNRVLQFPLYRKCVPSPKWFRMCQIYLVGNPTPTIICTFWHYESVHFGLCAQPWSPAGQYSCVPLGPRVFFPGKPHLTVVGRGLILKRRLIKVWAVYYVIHDSLNPSVYQPLFLITPGNRFLFFFFPQHYWHKIDKTVRCLK